MFRRTVRNGKWVSQKARLTEGINAIRGRHVLLLAETKYRYSPTYFANIVWCVLDKAVKWLNQVCV